MEFAETLKQHFHNSLDFRIIFENEEVVTVQANGFTYHDVQNIELTCAMHNFAIYEIWASTEKVKIKFKHKSIIEDNG